MKNIIFVGGIHGVGKSTLCKEACKTLKFEYLSASGLLKWAEVNNNKKNKEVENLDRNQDMLINGLINFVNSGDIYMLDGHFCLLNKKKSICKIPISTFESINPLAIITITEEISTILSRLKERDEISYDYNLLNEMQKLEIEYAKEIAKHLDIGYYEYKNHNFLVSINEFNQFITRK